MPIALELKDAITVITGIVTLTGVIWSTRTAVAKLELGQTEVLRQLTALHKRLDSMSERVTVAERQHAVLEERVANIRSSQRFKLATEPPLFKDEG
jgi:hypothetical protein